MTTSNNVILPGCVYVKHEINLYYQTHTSVQSPTYTDTCTLELERTLYSPGSYILSLSRSSSWPVCARVCRFVVIVFPLLRRWRSNKPNNTNAHIYQHITKNVFSVFITYNFIYSPTCLACTNGWSCTTRKKRKKNEGKNSIFRARVGIGFRFFRSVNSRYNIFMFYSFRDTWHASRWTSRGQRQTLVCTLGAVMKLHLNFLNFFHETGKRFFKLVSCKILDNQPLLISF